jgi:uncharacterized protein (TIGR03435 family)
VTVLYIERNQEIMFRHIVLRLTLAKKAAVLAAGVGALATTAEVGVVGALASQAQSPHPAGRSASATAPRFEVVSIRPCKVEDNRGGGGKKGGGDTIRWGPGRLTEECQTVFNLIRDAYFAYPEGKPWRVAALGDAGLNDPGKLACTGCGGGLPPVSNRQFRQPMKGSPTWLRSDRYTINAKAAEPESIEMMRGPMMQALLKERLKLKIHRENKEVPVYELTLAEDSSKLRPAKEGSCIPADRWEPKVLPSPDRPMPSGTLGGCGLPSWSASGLDFNGTTIANLCVLLSGWVDRDVIDKTGLAGMFDFHFDLPPRVAPEDGVSEESARFTALMPALGKLGLKLAPAKGLAQFLVIDHVERPSGN